MSSITPNAPRRERGVALIAALLILLVITILGMAMFRGFGLQQRIGGNMRDKAIAFSAALSTQNYAEWYVQQNNGANSTATVNCSGTSAASATSQMVCSNAIATTVAQPDTWGAAFTYSSSSSSSTASTCTTAGQAGCYAKLPQFYISYLGAAGSGTNTAYNSVLGQNNALFQIDAAGWGSTAQTVAVVQSSFTVSTISTVIPPSSSSSTVLKNIYLGGP